MTRKNGGTFEVATLSTETLRALAKTPASPTLAGPIKPVPWKSVR